MTCIYCAGRRGEQPMSLEHIWPAALGGNYTPAEFRTEDVCQPCNSIAGQFVDAAFIKTFFVTSERINGAHEYLDANAPGVVPLLYYGFDQSFRSVDDVCERWVGPAGEHVFHIHSRDDPRWDTIAGGDFFRRKGRDPGRVYMYLTSPSDYWIIAAFVSVAEYFPIAYRRCLTICSGIPERYCGFNFPSDPVASEKEAEEVAWIEGRSHPTSSYSHLPVQVDFADRFMAKIALGFCHTFLGGKASLSSPYSNALRAMLWSKTIDERENISIRGSGYFQGALAPLSRFLHWPGVWSFYFGQMGEFFGMAMFTPSGRGLSMVLSDDPTCWREDLPREIRGGAVYLVVPQRRHTFGPLPIMDCVSHRLGHPRHPDLITLEAWRTGINSLPAKRPDSSQ